MLVNFEADTHTYTDEDGKILPSVTQILQGVGIIVPTIFAPGAAAFGTSVHEILECIDKGFMTAASFEDTDASGYVKAYTQFLTDTKFKVTSVELIHAHEEYRYAGTVDRIGLWPTSTQKCVIDLKTGSKQPWHALQTAAYAMLIDPAKPYNLERYCLYLKRTGKYKLEQYKDRNDYSIFTAALLVHKWKAK